MSRDMKPRKRANGTRRKSGGGTLLGLFVGLVIGVLAAAAVVWYIHRTPPPFTARTQPPAQPAPQQQQQPATPSQTAPAPQAPLALPGKPGDPVPQALVITGIVVAFSATALAVALLLRLDAAGGPTTLDDVADGEH